MTSLAPISPSFATISVQHHYAAAAITAVAPWRGILAVEPDSGVLSAKALLLTKANYCVTPATGLGDLFTLRNTKAFALAILSDRLGQRLIGTVAETVRRQWPRMRILILGKVPSALDDYLYDEQICRSSDPQQVIADLEWLYEGMWNERSKGINWNASRSALCSSRRPIPESDPTKAVPQAPTEDRILRGIPKDVRILVTGAKRRAERWNEPLPRKTTMLPQFVERPS